MYRWIVLIRFSFESRYFHIPNDLTFHIFAISSPIWIDLIGALTVWNTIIACIQSLCYANIHKEPLFFINSRTTFNHIIILFPKCIRKFVSLLLLPTFIHLWQSILTFRIRLIVRKSRLNDSKDVFFVHRLHKKMNICNYFQPLYFEYSSVKMISKLLRMFFLWNLCIYICRNVTFYAPRAPVNYTMHEPLEKRCRKPEKIIIQNKLTKNSLLLHNHLTNITILDL